MLHFVDSNLHVLNVPKSSCVLFFQRTFSDVLTPRTQAFSATHPRLCWREKNISAS